MQIEFKVKKQYRIIISTIAILFCMSLLRDGYIFLTNGKNTGSVHVNVILFVCTLVLIYFALKSIISSYQIIDGELKVRSLFRKVRSYPISQLDVVEIVSDRFPIIQLHFSDDNKVILMPIENESEFIEILKEKMKSIGKPWTFMKE